MLVLACLEKSSHIFIVASQSMGRQHKAVLADVLTGNPLHEYSCARDQPRLSQRPQYFRKVIIVGGLCKCKTGMNARGQISLLKLAKLLCFIPLLFT